MLHYAYSTRYQPCNLFTARYIAERGILLTIKNTEHVNGEGLGGLGEWLYPELVIKAR